MINKDLSIEFCGIKTENPFFLASAPIASNYQMIARALEAGWGGAVFKTVGLFVADEVSPRFDHVKKEGTPFLGFKNLEQTSEYPLEKNLEEMSRIKENFPDKVLIASIMAEEEKDWTKLAQLVTQTGVDIIECNFSCPQMTSDKMGADVGQNPELVKAYTAAVKRGTDLPILAKMTPNLGNMISPALAAIDGGATGLAAINTIKSITSIDLANHTPLPIINGQSAVSGYSGKAVKPIALRFIHELASFPDLNKIPISGIGGIENWQDALEFLLLGSSNLQICTAVMQYGYRIVEDMINGLSYYMEEKGFASLDQLVGLALDNIVSADKLDRDFIVYPQVSKEKCIGCGRCYISCEDGGHQAINWSKTRRPTIIKNKCVGCHLCSQVCPAEAIGYGEVEFKAGREQRAIII
ncbi:dihydropyrimidine dehydrogenase (NAD+) subunit PreA [Orenia metallireducens]|uniref:Dihydroorotate dehydrogenase B (NAD(+)), catalytic subunit n=1 Tax=Orenia metallireducens TaxID=1413210 RepID=A0A285I060_9FIRM|nr:NAD-dependent dihydropyrimidine dehydrogenase subunit PreA [Orenia metallireducens]SNY41339.1 dihydropyrimidine dehydrogenase (NAD+) subunit PreA [Orenia metallireducens]